MNTVEVRRAIFLRNELETLSRIWSNTHIYYPLVLIVARQWAYRFRIKLFLIISNETM